MRTLKDVYIKVNKSNHQWLSELFDSSSLELNIYIVFYAEDYRCKYYYSSAPKNKQKVSLSQLKRLINTIPTREEITRLKRQISAYKTNLSLVNERCKELQSDNNILNSNLVIKENLISSLNNDIKKYDSLFIQKNEEIKQIEFYKKRSEAMTKQRQDIYKLYEDLHLEFEAYKTNDLEHKSNKIALNLLQDEVLRLTKENEQLKKRKWWQIWNK